MKSLNKLFYLALIFILAVSSLNAQKKAQESDDSRKLKADSADKHIRFITPAEFSVHINKGLWIIMYGANWCKYTQKLTPKWLGLQTRVRAENLSKDINVAKVECTKDMDFCTSQGIDGFPTVYVYENGKKYEEYLGNHEVNEMFTYVQEQVARYKSEEVVEEVVTVYVEEVVYENEAEENKPRKSNKNDYQQQQQQQQQQQTKAKTKSQQLPKRKTKNNNKKTKPPKNQQNKQDQQANPPKRQPTFQNKRDTKQAPKYIPPKNAPPKYRAAKDFDKLLFPPKRPNVVVKATKRVFGLVESLITLAIILIIIYIIVRFKAIKGHSSYSKSKIPLYRDLTQEEKFMLHYS